MQTEAFLADLPATEPIFKQTETYGTQRRVEAHVKGVKFALTTLTTRTVLYVDASHMSATFGFEPALARAFAAELIAGADLIERGAK